jgi:hypothetical protein
VKALAPAVLRHRLLLSPAAEIEGRQAEDRRRSVQEPRRRAERSGGSAPLARRLSHGAGHAAAGGGRAAGADRRRAGAGRPGSSHPRSAGLLLLVLLDALFAGGLRAVRLLAPRDAEVGEPRARAGGGACPRAALAGRRPRWPSIPGWRRAGGWAAAGGGERRRLGDATSPQPARNRRDRAVLAALVSRSGLPTGRSAESDALVRVRPNIAPVRWPALQIFLRDAQFGMIARRIAAKAPISRRWPIRTRHGPAADRLESSARHALCSPRNTRSSATTRSSSPSIAGRRCASRWRAAAHRPRRYRRATTACGAEGAGSRGSSASRRPQVDAFVTHSRDFVRLQHAAATLDYHAEEPNFTLALAQLSRGCSAVR